MLRHSQYLQQASRLFSVIENQLSLKLVDVPVSETEVNLQSGS